MIDAEWQRLNDEKQEVRNEKYPLLKFAAMFVGILMLSGIAIAAIQSLTHSSSPNGEESIYTQAQDTVVKHSTPASTGREAGARIYDNVPLGEIFKELSDYYNVKVVYQNEDAPRLRLFYQWKPEYTLEKVVEMLNNFEWIQIQAENDTLFIRTTANPAKDC